MAIDQTHYRFRTDGDAADATPTWGANEDVTFNPAANAFRLRLGLANSGDAVSGEFELYAKKNSGSYAAVTTITTDLRSYDASTDADDTPIRIPRLSITVPSTPANAYVAEDGSTLYVAEDGTTYLVQET